MNTKLTRLQINLQHCQVASLALAQVILDLDADFIFIQEPYTTMTATTKVPNIPPGYKAYEAINTLSLEEFKIAADDFLLTHNTPQ